MAVTIPRVEATTSWQALSSVTGIPAGTAIKIQHIGGSFVDVVISAIEPVAPNQAIGEQLRTQDWFAVASGEADVWVKTSSPTQGSSALLSVQENA